MKYTLNEDQSKAVRELSEAVDEVLEANILVPVNFSASREKLKSKAEQLESAFPNIAVVANEYFHSDADTEADWIAESDDHSEAAFRVLISTLMFDQAETLSRYTRVLSELSSEISDLATWSKDFDVNYGQWK
jgi:hypothetical protein